MLCNSFHRVALSSLWSKAISICKIGPFPFKAASWEQRPAPPPHFGLWSVYKLSLPHLFICSGRRGGTGESHSKTTCSLTHTTQNLHLFCCIVNMWGCLLRVGLSVQEKPEGCGWAGSKCAHWTPLAPPTPQEFVIPKRSWVSREVGVEEVWWIKLLSSLTHFAFPLNTVAWWITIGQEEVGGVGEKRRGRKCSKRDWCLVPAWNDL